MKISRILLILTICIIAIASHAVEEDLKAIALQSGYLYKESNAGSNKITSFDVGEKFEVVSIGNNWIETKYGENSVWLKKTKIALSNDMKYAGKLVVKNNYVHLASKMGGKDNKVVRELNKGDIATIIDAKYSSNKMYQVELDDGTTGWLKSNFFTRIGPMTEEEKSKHKFYEKFIRKDGKLYSMFEKFDTWGKTTKTAGTFVFIFSIIFFLLPYFLLSKYTNLVCSIKFIPTWLIKLSHIYIFFQALQYLMPIYIAAPIYENLYIGIGFMFLLFLWIGREWKKILYHRCPKCRSMWATANRGNIFLGGWRTTHTKKYSDGSKEVSTSITESYRDDRECLVCGHRWSIRRTKTR